MRFIDLSSQIMNTLFFQLFLLFLLSFKITLVMFEVLKSLPEASYLVFEGLVVLFFCSSHDEFFHELLYFFIHSVAAIFEKLIN